MDTLSLNNGEQRNLVFIDTPDLDLHILQAEDSLLRLFVFDFHSANNILHIDHKAPNCTTEIYHLAFLHGSDSVSTHTRMHHEIGEGTSRQLIKFVLDDNSKGDFLGELVIKPDAQHVDAQQNNRNLLLSKTATMRTRPQLEIYADDVQASHGASTGQLDEAALFYMQQRGISKEKARQLLVGAFMKDVIATISDEALREQLLNTIDGVVE